MGEPTPGMQALALKLLALEKQSDPGSNAGTDVATLVIEKLRAMLTRFSGEDSFNALMRRALALSRTEDHSLAGRTITQYDSVSSFEGLSHETTLMVIGHLLDLMSTFVGRALALRLIRDTWPAADLQDR